MNQLVLHHTTSTQLDLALRRPSHGYLFVGQPGLGKTQAAHNFAKALLGSHATTGDIERWILLIAPEEGKKISISQAKEVAGFVNRKIPSGIESKVVIIDHAELLGIEAANSLLLLIEEPPPSTVIIFVSDSIDSLPKTILSRLQLINFYAPTKAQLAGLIETLNIPAEITNIIGRVPAKLEQSCSQEELNHIIEINIQAEAMLSTSLPDRLIVASSIDSKPKAAAIISALAVKLQAQSPSTLWLKRSNSLILAQLHLYNNGSPKFVIESLALEFE